MNLQKRSLLYNLCFVALVTVGCSGTDQQKISDAVNATLTAVAPDDFSEVVSPLEVATTALVVTSTEPTLAAATATSSPIPARVATATARPTLTPTVEVTPTPEVTQAFLNDHAAITQIDSDWIYARTFESVSGRRWSTLSSLVFGPPDSRTFTPIEFELSILSVDNELAHIKDGLLSVFRAEAQAIERAQRGWKEVNHRNVAQYENSPVFLNPWFEAQLARKKLYETWLELLKSKAVEDSLIRDFESDIHDLYGYLE